MKVISDTFPYRKKNQVHSDKENMGAWQSDPTDINVHGKWLINQSRTWSL
jgi:hypothetical protein